MGLSGGVDSSVSAGLLREQGYDVTGVFIKIWQPEFLECTWRTDRLDAMRVAATLGIPFKEIDLSDVYKKTVIDDMIQEYSAGRTPNPDVLCNRYVKFGAFKEWAWAQGADFVATGHYARIEKHNDGYALLRGVDTNKDQSYFLWRLTQSDLSRTLLPVGHLTKPQVRAHALRSGLPNAKKKDSQGLCFVGDIHMESFLRRYIDTAPGSVLDTNGQVIGTHHGAALYTLGQRHGFTAQGTHEHYVISTDVAQNTVTVADSATQAEVTRISLSDINLMTSRGSSLTAQSRYREKPVAISLDGHEVTFSKPHLAAPGQSLVIYDGDICIGGGIIGTSVNR